MIARAACVAHYGKAGAAPGTLADAGIDEKGMASDHFTLAEDVFKN